jgi:hypothetical protein
MKTDAKGSRPKVSKPCAPLAAISITITPYDGIEKKLSPVTSLRIRKLAERLGKSEDEVVSQLLDEARHMGNFIFCPAGDSTCKHRPKRRSNGK